MNNLINKLSTMSTGKGSPKRAAEEEDQELSTLSPPSPYVRQPSVAVLPLSNDNLTRFNSMSPPYRPPGRFIQDACDPVQIGRPYAVWPPVVERLESHGLVSDLNGIEYSRDIGRTSVIGGRVWMSFGDTFIKNHDNEFLGVTNHTVASIPYPNDPVRSRYLEFEEHGWIQSFVPFTDEETAFEREQAKLPEKDRIRYTLWSFGGMVEDPDQRNHGFIWFEVGHNYYPGRGVPLGAGMAYVNIDPDTRNLRCTRLEPMVWALDEPRVGCFSALQEGGFLYCWGHHGDGVILARVPLAGVFDRNEYRFWQGSGYVETRRAVEVGYYPVIKNVTHGAFFKSELFAPGNGAEWLFVGCTSFADHKVALCAAPAVEGPWTETLRICTIEEPGRTIKQYPYCVYPHPWRHEESSGKLMIGWSEHWPGGVHLSTMYFRMGARTWLKSVRYENATMQAYNYFESKAGGSFERSKAAKSITFTGDFVRYQGDPGAEFGPRRSARSGEGVVVINITAPTAELCLEGRMMCDSMMKTYFSSVENSSASRPPTRRRRSTLQKIVGALCPSLD